MNISRTFFPVIKCGKKILPSMAHALEIRTFFEETAGLSKWKSAAVNSERFGVSLFFVAFLLLNLFLKAVTAEEGGIQNVFSDFFFLSFLHIAEIHTILCERIRILLVFHLRSSFNRLNVYQRNCLKYNCKHFYSSIVMETDNCYERFLCYILF